MLHRTPMAPLAPRFPFAGFVWPRYVATLPTGTLAARIAARRRPALVGPYYHDPLPNSNEGRGFYLGDAGMPCMRWAWADECEGARIEHRGWFCDDSQDVTIRGLVLRLPHGRFLAGWTMGEGMASACEERLYHDIAEAAQAADELARIAAEREREYQAQEAARLEDEEREAALGIDD